MVTKEILKTLKIMILGFILVMATIIIKYKPVYEVKVNNEVLGYIENIEQFENTIQEKILSKEGQNIEGVDLSEKPEYELKLIQRKKETNEDFIIAKLDETSITTYKFYSVTLNSKTKEFVDTLEQAEQVVENIKDEYKDEKDIELDIAINENFTQNIEEVKIETTENVEKTMEQEIEELLEEEEAKKAIATINGINVSVLPVAGRITSRFNESSSIRSGNHTGLDIACATGTDIKVVAAGTVVFASYNGAYGNLLKVDHGNGVQTWYAHCSKLIAKVGDEVEAGDVIGKVGSTGNSTGPHLHLEIRIDGVAMNPQKYLYN